MAVHLNLPGQLHAVAGVRIGAADAGIRNTEGEDLVVFELPAAASIASVFTQNMAQAAPVKVARHHLLTAGAQNPGATRALVVNSGNANAGLGSQGVDDCMAVCNMVATELGIAATSVIPFSTGVIGERLPLEKFTASISDCLSGLHTNNWLSAARAIMTTDTIEKAVSRQIQLDNGARVTLTGVAKGSGMIDPTMATMVAFIATDAQVGQCYFQTVLNHAVEQSFNCISIDGDMSTNDACLLIASAQSGVSIGHSSSQSTQQKFSNAILDIAVQLAQAMVRDGEGATKFITIRVSGGSSDHQCGRVAKTGSNSPLVKTAMHGSGPNWGRIYAAVGRSGLELLDKLCIFINDVEVMTGGSVSPRYVEKDAAAAMDKAELTIRIELGTGQQGQAVVWTTDLGYEYVRINADYRS